MYKLYEINQDVQKAIDLKKPIVALESTLISHGLPYPENINVANESIKAIEESGAIAATIGIIKSIPIIPATEEPKRIRIITKTGCIPTVFAIRYGDTIKLSIIWTIENMPIINNT